MSEKSNVIVSNAPWNKPLPNIDHDNAAFWEGLKAGLLTFGGAFTVIPFLQQSSVDVHHWLTNSQFVDGLAGSSGNYSVSASLQ